MRRQHVTIAILLSCCLQCVSVGGQRAVERVIEKPLKHSVDLVGETTEEYIGRRPDRKFRIIDPRAITTGGSDKTGTPASQAKKTRLYAPDETDNYPADSAYGFKLDDDFRKRRAETAYPTLYQPGYAKGVILVIGFPGCAWCKQQLQLIPGVEFPDMKKKPMIITSDKYRVLYVHRDKADSMNTDRNDQKEKVAPTWDDLRVKFGLRKMYPAIAIVERGKMVKTFEGFKPWATIEPHTTNTKLKEKDEPKPKPKRRRFLDFLFSENDVREPSGTVRPIGITNYGASPVDQTRPKARLVRSPHVPISSSVPKRVSPSAQSGQP